ncbi:MAG: hypothetical protein IPK39_15925 [Sulfuritalea sp.]|nr:hypothetical protein [Sulfuritalea sp.]
MGAVDRVQAMVSGIGFIAVSPAPTFAHDRPDRCGHHREAPAYRLKCGAIIGTID